MNNHCYNRGSCMVCNHSQDYEKEIEGKEKSVCRKWNYLAIPLLAHTLYNVLIKKTQLAKILFLPFII